MLSHTFSQAVEFPVLLPGSPYELQDCCHELHCVKFMSSKMIKLYDVDLGILQAIWIKKGKGQNK